MKRTVATFASLLMLAWSAAAQSTWTVDNAHSNVKFTVSHLVIAEVEGSFKEFSGTLTAKDNFSDASVDFTVNAASIDTDNERRDAHLRSEDFFAAEKYPTITFKGVSWKKLGDQRYELLGDLTMRGVTKRVAFDVAHGGTIKDPYGNTKAGFKATATVNRFDYGLHWNSLTEAGGAVVGKDVKIQLNLEFTQQKKTS